MPEEQKEEKGVTIVGKNPKGVVIIDKTSKTPEPRVEITEGEGDKDA